MRHIRSPLLALGAVVAAGLVATPAAPAATIWADATTIYIEGGDEASNIASMYTSSRIRDNAGDLVPAAGCEVDQPGFIYCGEGKAVVANLGGGNDRMEDFNRRVTIDGGPGDDVIGGGSGTIDQTFYGGEGNDTINGGAGNDTLDGGPGDDTVDGGIHDDVVIGGPGRDWIVGDRTYEVDQHGRDRLDSRDGQADQVECGYGMDEVVGDDIDLIGNGCEFLDLQPVAPPPKPPEPPKPQPDDTTSVEPSEVDATVAVVAFGAKIGALMRGRYSFMASFLKAGTATVSLRVSATEARRARLGRRAVDLAGLGKKVTADVYTLKLRSYAKLRRALRRVKRVRATLTVALYYKDEAGFYKSSKDTARVTFKR